MPKILFQFKTRQDLDDFLETQGMDALVSHLTGLITKVAMKFWTPAHEQNAGLEVCDYVTIGQLDVAKAASSWDPSQSKFNSHITRLAKYRMLDYLRQTTRISRLTMGQIKKFAHATNKLTQELGRVPQLEEILERLGWSKDHYLEVSSRANFAGWLQIENDGKGEDYNPEHLTLGNLSMMRKSDRPEEDHQRVELFKRIFKKLPQYYDKVAFYLYFCVGLTMQEVGLALDLSESRCSQAISSYLNILAPSAMQRSSGNTISSGKLQYLFVAKWEQLNELSRQKIVSEFNLTSYFPQRKSDQTTNNAVFLKIDPVNSIGVPNAAISDTKRLCMVFELS